MTPSKPLHDPLAPPLPGAATETRNTTCYMCACRCGIRVHVRNGEVRYIEGNPDHPVNKGVICAKGSSGIMKQYSPARLTQPLLRKPGSDRGAGEFVAIGWDEAFRSQSAFLLRNVKWGFLFGAFVLPAVLLASALAGAPRAAIVAAFVVQYLGLIAERWYFFAQANHPQNLYYQAIA